MLSCRVAGRAPGERFHGLLLDNKGRVLADLDLWTLEHELLALSDTEAIEAAADVLQRYVLRSSVTVDVRSQENALIRLDAHAARAVGLAESEAGVTAARIEGVSATVARGGRLPGHDLLVDADATAEVFAMLEAQGMRQGDRGDWDRQRIEAGIPAFGAELTGAELPQEARLDAALDYDKGCFPGQETVARLHYRGHVNRLLCRLSSNTRLVAGDPLQDGERTVGAVTSAVHDGATRALAYVRFEQAEARTPLAAPDGSAVSIASWPGAYE